MKKLGLLVMPLMVIPLLMSCGGDTPAEQVEFLLSSDLPTTVEGKTATVYVDWKPTDTIRFSSFTFTASPAKDNTVTFDQTGDPRPMPVKITFTEDITSDISGTLNFAYEDVTSKTTGNSSVSVTIFVPLELEKCSWEKIDEISKSGKASERFKVGNTKTVKVNGVDHKVRIIGFNQDKDKNGKELGITFEFANLISDSEGYSLATQWNDTTFDGFLTGNYNYLNSSVRYALNKKTGEGGCDHILWSQKGATKWSNELDGPYTDKSVLEMLPNELVSVLKTPSKYINVNEGNVEMPLPWEEKTVEDKLFLLSPFEMGRTEHTDEEAHTTTYSYYKNAKDSDRVKKQVKNEEYKPEETPKIPGESGQTCILDVSNYAGYNLSTEATEGGYSWLRSPFANNTGYYAWNILPDGKLFNYSGSVVNQAFSVAPAFCI